MWEGHEEELRDALAVTSVEELEAWIEDVVGGAIDSTKHPDTFVAPECSSPCLA